MQVPAWLRLVLMESPQGAAMGVAHHEVIATAVVSVPPTALDALRAGQDAVVLNSALTRLG